MRCHSCPLPSALQQAAGFLSPSGSVTLDKVTPSLADQVQAVMDELEALKARQKPGAGGSIGGAYVRPGDWRDEAARRKMRRAEELAKQKAPAATMHAPN